MTDWNRRAQRYANLQWTTDNAWARELTRPEFVAGKILDAGCGPGHAGLAFPDQELLGLDLSPAMARRCPFPVTIGSVTSMPFLADESFDGALARMLFHHLLDDDLPRALKELARVVKPGGKLLVAEGVPPPGCLEWYAEMFALKEERRSFYATDLLKLITTEEWGPPFYLNQWVMPGCSLRNWLENATENGPEILRMHLDMPENLKQAYHMRVVGDPGNWDSNLRPGDVRLDFHFAVLVVTRQ